MVRLSAGARFLFGLILLCLSLTPLAGFDRVPRPDFESEYEIPLPTTPEPRSPGLEYLDIGVLAAALLLASFFALKLRRRVSIVWLTIFSVTYFGFIRKGCICPVGATQNITLALFAPSYIVPISAILLFALPIITALFFGRTFCSSVCPLGMIQELVIIKPLKIPDWLRRPLGFIPVLYLGFAVLFAATGADFIVCRFDPFVNLFRFGGGFEILLIGAIFIAVGMFVARPYCRFFCPYGLILSWVSRVSRRNVTITPDTCIQCTMCEDACPVDAIRTPSPERPDSKKSADRRRLRIVLVMTPIIILASTLGGRSLYRVFARMHPTVRTAEQVVKEDAGLVAETTLESETFRASRSTKAELLEQAEIISGKFRVGSAMLGVFFGLLFCLYLINLYRREISPDFRPDRGHCVSCGRCFSYCPREHVKRKKVAVSGG